MTVEREHIVTSVVAMANQTNALARALGVEVDDRFKV